MYLCIHVENFQLLAVLRMQDIALSQPTALANEAGRLLQVSQNAFGQGAMPGMAATKALSRCANLKVLHASPQAESMAERLLWNAAWQISPKIEMTHAGIATLALFEMEFEALVAKVETLQQTLRQSGLSSRVAAAQTPEWAYLAAVSSEQHRFRYLKDAATTKEHFEGVPLQAIQEVPKAMIEIINDWGVYTLGQFARLPRQSVAQRLGKIVLDIWDVLNGTFQRKLQFKELAPDFSQSFDLEDPIASMEPVCFILQRAADGLEQQLTQACKVAQVIRLSLKLEKGPAYKKEIRLPEVTRDAGLLVRLLRHHLERVELQSAIVGISLEIEPTHPLGRQASLFSHTLRNPWCLVETLDQLTGIVGEDNLGSPRLKNTHKPDQFALVPLATELEKSNKCSEKITTNSMEPIGLIGPPLHRYRPPRAVELVIVNGVFQFISSSILNGRVLNQRGPFRFSGDWWEISPWSIEEWDIEVANQGVYRIAKQSKRWKLVGAYD